MFLPIKSSNDPIAVHRDTFFSSSSRDLDSSSSLNDLNEASYYFHVGQPKKKRPKKFKGLCQIEKEKYGVMKKSHETCTSDFFLTTPRLKDKW